ncbi:hypothetical protein, partial [Bradyrhizobium sp. CCBAU 53380]|uniref:hypothetical protein n=1 Tax=Bradyrhizobium sp. CCBAU 53380 TaxID=1325117 RepID=UPI00230324AD
WMQPQSGLRPARYPLPHGIFAALAMTEQEAAASLFQIRIVIADTLSRPRGLSRPSFACRLTLD